MIIAVDGSTLLTAGRIHAESWKASHADFCSEQFIHRHTAPAQTLYLRDEMRRGKQLYMLVKHAPVGIVSVMGNLIENLYILPAEQHKGYGTELLLFAIEKCDNAPCLWILDNNKSAYSLYTKYGFRLTGNRHKLSETLSELEMAKLP